jgi:hypothetical protein
VKGGDISDVSSPQVICVTDVVIGLKTEEEKKFLSRRSTVLIGDVDMISANKLWVLANNYGVSSELAVCLPPGLVQKSY